MEFLIVTGLSGAGKSRAVAALEDIGFYCVDNMPASMIPKFYQITACAGEVTQKVAVVTDMRSGSLFGTLLTELDQLKEEEKEFKIMFLDADNETLIRRFKETRRRHPLSEKYMGAISDAIEAEREALAQIRLRADFIIDTTHLRPVQLKQLFSDMFLNSTQDALMVHCMSFGFKNGIPMDADMIIDVRCLPNPFYIDEIKDLTGLDKEIKDYVMSFEQTQVIIQKFSDLLDYMMPLFYAEGKSQVTIAVGCTGGKHRSVTVAQALCSHLKKSDIRVSVTHRDILKK